MPPRIVITRPAHEAAQWVAALQLRGLPAQSLPLIQITAPQDTELVDRLHTAQQQLAQYDAVMVVSGQAARYFWTPAAVQTLACLVATVHAPRVWAPGPGTASTLEALGMAPSCIDQPANDAPQFDSEALWQQVHTQIRPGCRVLIVRGSNATAFNAPTEGSGRDWLTHQLQQAGALVHTVVAYQRAAPHLTPDEKALAVQAAHDGSLWLFSSSQAIAHLQAQLPTQSWQQALALTTHPRIAAAAQAMGFGTVRQCRPALKDVAVSIESMP